jgi:prepilin-type N-terminal cleavage/methylation domain-containing protein
MNTSCSRLKKLGSGESVEDRGFTLAELLVVIVVLFVFGALLLPALAGNRIDTQAFVCMNNTKRLASAWLMYASDQQDRLVPASSWVAHPGNDLDWTSSPANTNSSLLIDPNDSLIALYVRDTRLFKCPADVYQSGANPGPRVRSYSLSGAVGGVGLAPSSPGYPVGRTYPSSGAIRMTDLNLPGPTQVITFVDEHPDSINDGVFVFNAGYVPASYQWRDLPASFHNASGSFSFADGHSEIHKWGDSRTCQTVRLFPRWWSPGSLLPVPSSVDYAWFNDRIPYH